MFESSSTDSQLTSSLLQFGQTAPARFTSGTGSPTNESPNRSDSASRGNSSGGSAGYGELLVPEWYHQEIVRVCRVGDRLHRAANDPGAVRAFDQIKPALGVDSDSHGVRRFHD